MSNMCKNLRVWDVMRTAFFVVHIVPAHVGSAGFEPRWMAEVELAAAVGAVEEAVQRAYVPDVFLPASAAFPHLMDGLPGVFINDGSLRVFRDDPVGFIIERSLMGFVGDGLSPVADRVTAVLIPVENVEDRTRMPHCLRCFKRHSFSLRVLVPLGEVITGRVIMQAFFAF